MSSMSLATFKPTKDHQNVIKINCELGSLNQDEKKINNRIKMLNVEQQRILKKVDETRLRASKLQMIK